MLTLEASVNHPLLFRDALYIVIGAGASLSH